MSNSRQRKYTDQELRDAIAEGLKPKEIAERYKVSASSVSQRIKQLGVTTVSAVVAPEESERFVTIQFNVMEELAGTLTRVKLLMDACDEWLRSADNPEKYDIGARAGDVDVTYWDIDYSGPGEAKSIKVRKPLDELLRIVEGKFMVEKAEFHHADPRVLILQTFKEVRQTVETTARLMQMVANMKTMEDFMETVLTEISRVAPEVAKRITERLQSSPSVSAAFGRPGGAQPARAL